MIFLFEVQLGEPCVIWVVNFFVETCWHISCFACEKCLLIQIIERKPELAKLEALDCGKPYDEAAWDMVHDTPYTSVYFFSSLTCWSVCHSFYQDDVAGCFEYFADQAEALDKRQNSPVSLPMETFKCHLRREPIGVVGLITPWYFHFCPTSVFFLFLLYSWSKHLGKWHVCSNTASFFIRLSCIPEKLHIQINHTESV